MTEEPGLGTYLVERYWPGVTEEVLTAALERATSGRGRGRLRHIHSVLVPSDEVVFSVFQAASAADVELANRLADAPFERVVEAVGLGLSPDGSGSSG
jgi:hypothetical protein